MENSIHCLLVKLKLNFINIFGPKNISFFRKCLYSGCFDIRLRFLLCCETSSCLILCAPAIRVFEKYNGTEFLYLFGFPDVFVSGLVSGIGSYIFGKFENSKNVKIKRKVRIKFLGNEYKSVTAKYVFVFFQNPSPQPHNFCTVARHSEPL